MFIHVLRAACVAPSGHSPLGGPSVEERRKGKGGLRRLEETPTAPLAPALLSAGLLLHRPHFPSSPRDRTGPEASAQAGPSAGGAHRCSCPRGPVPSHLLSSVSWGLSGGEADTGGARLGQGWEGRYRDSHSLAWSERMQRGLWG